MSDSLGPSLLRPDLRGRTPYGAPQLDVPVRLNTNENSYAVPAEVVARPWPRPWPRWRGSLNRYPDREFTALREALAAYLGADHRRRRSRPSRCGPATAPTRCCCTCSRPSAARAARRSGSPRRTRCTRSSPARPAPPGSTGCAACPAAERSTSTPDRRSRQVARAPTRTWSSCARRTTRPAPRSALDVVEAVYDAAPERDRRRRRGLRRVRPARHAERADPARGPAAARRHPHHEQGVRARRRPAGLPRRRPRRSIDALRLVRMPYHLSAPTQAVALRGARPTPTPCWRPSRPSRASATGSSPSWPRSACTPVPERRQLRPLRRPRRRARHLAGAARPRRPRPRRRASPTIFGSRRAPRPRPTRSCAAMGRSAQPPTGRSSPHDRAGRAGVDARDAAPHRVHPPRHLREQRRADARPRRHRRVRHQHRACGSTTTCWPACAKHS